MSKDRSCAANGCNNINYLVYRDDEHLNRKFFRFPLNNSMCLKWIEQLNRPDLLPLLQRKGPREFWTNYRVCSDHFVKADIKHVIKRNKNIIYLMKKAVPMLNLGNQNEIYLPELPAAMIEEEAEDQEKQEMEDEEQPEEAEEVEIKLEAIEDNSEEEIRTGNIEGLPVKAALNQEISPVNPQMAPHSSDDQEVRKKRSKTLTSVCEALKQRLKSMEMLMENYQSEIDFYRERFEDLNQMCAHVSFHSKDKDVCNKKNKDKYNKCQKDFALELYMKSPHTYKYLQEKFHLPHTLVLYKWKLEKERKSMEAELQIHRK